MKINKFFLATLLTLTLLLGACQPQAATSTAAPASESASTVETGSDTPTVAAATEAPQVQNSSLFARLSELAGTVDLKQAGQASFSPANAETELDVNGQVQTGSDGRVRLDLSSGTIIRVAPSSLFTLTSNEEVEGGLLTKIKLELGKIFIILNGGAAEVQTPSGVAAVQGSYLKVEFDSVTGDLTLTCLEGSCSVTTPNGETKEFTDGQKIKLHKDSQTGEWILDEGPMSPEDFQEWLDNNPEAKALVEQSLNDAAAGGSGGNSGGGGNCFSITQPGAGSNLPFQGKIKFEWGAQPNATKYIVKFTNANGDFVMFETANTSIDQYIESFLPDAGNFSWSVTALDGSGNEICTPDPFTFSKPASNWEPAKNEKEKDEKLQNNDTETCIDCNPYPYPY